MQLDANTANLITGLLFVTVPVAAWAVVGGQRPRALNEWCLGGLLIGAHLVMLSLRPVLPAWAGYELAVLFGFAGPQALAEALRAHAVGPRRLGSRLLELALLLAIYSALLRLVESPLLRICWALLVQAGFLGRTVAWAWHIGRAERSRSAFIIGGFCGVLCAMLLVRLTGIALGLFPPVVSLGSGPAWDLVALSLSAILCCIFTNTALIALLLEDARREEVQAVARQVEMAERQRLAGQVAHLERRSGLGQMAGALGHEINQPLTAILSNAQLLERGLRAGTVSAAESAEVASRVVHNTRRASQIVERIRSYIRPTRSGSESVDLQRVAQDAIDLVSEEARLRGVKVELWVTPVPPVPANAVELSQVLLNLCRNALQALEGTAGGRLRLVIARIGDEVELRVEDNGPGFSPAELSQALVPFFTTKPDGLGLGLAICNDIAQRWGGRLLLENGEAGAIVRLRLPVRAGPVQHQPIDEEEEA